MADPIIAIGGREGEHLEGWAAREQRRIQVLRRKQQGDLEHMVTLTKKLSKNMEPASISKIERESLVMSRDEQEVLANYKERIAQDLERKRVEQEQLESSHAELLEDLKREMDEVTRERAEATKAAQERAKQILKGEERKREVARKDYEDKQRAITEYQKEAAEVKKERLAETAMATRARCDKNRSKWLTNQKYQANEREKKEKEKDQAYQARLKKLKQQQRDQIRDKQKKEGERSERLRQSLLDLEAQDCDKRNNYLTNLMNKNTYLKDKEDERKQEHFSHCKEVRDWRNYISDIVTYRRDVEQAKRSYTAAKVDRCVALADEITTRKEHLRRTAREMHMQQALMRGAVKGAYMETHEKIVRGSSQKVALPEVKMPPAPTLKEMKLPTVPIMPEIADPAKPRPVYPKRSISAGNSGFALEGSQGHKTT